MRTGRSFLRIHSQHINMDLLFKLNQTSSACMIAIIHGNNAGHYIQHKLAVFLLYDRAVYKSVLV